MTDRIINTRDTETTALERRVEGGGSLIYPINGLTAFVGGYRSNTLEIVLTQNLPLLMLACITPVVSSGSAQSGYTLYFNVNGSRVTAFPHTGVGDEETAGTRNVTLLQAPGIGTHQIYAEIVEGSASIVDVLGEWSGLVLVGAEGSGDIS